MKDPTGKCEECKFTITLAMCYYCECGNSRPTGCSRRCVACALRLNECLICDGPLPLSQLIYRINGPSAKTE